MAGLLLGLGFGLLIFKGFPSRASASTAIGDASGTQTPGVVPASWLGSPAPGFELADLEGTQHRLSQYRGDVVLLNFWATWCEPCRVEMPAIDKRYRQLRDKGFVVLGVDFDEPAAEVRAFRDQVNVSFPLLLDPGGKVQSLYRILGYPTSFFVDREGIVRIMHIGIMDDSQMDQYLKQVGLE
jgi:peroxiredoxin